MPHSGADYNRLLPQTPPICRIRLSCLFLSLFCCSIAYFSVGQSAAGSCCVAVVPTSGRSCVEEDQGQPRGSNQGVVMTYTLVTNI